MGEHAFQPSCYGYRSIHRDLNRDRQHWHTRRYGTGSGSDRVPVESPAPPAPGRYRSRYRTNVTCFNLGSRIERRSELHLDPRSFIFDPRSSILDHLSLLPCYPHVVDGRLDEASASGVRRLDEDSDRPSGELAEIHRGGGKGCVILSGSSKLLKYRGRRSAVHDTHPEEVGCRGIVQVGQVIREGQREGGSS